MAVTCKLQRKGDLTQDGGGYQISDVYLIEGYSVGINQRAILTLAQNPPVGEDVVPEYGDLYPDPAIPCQRLTVSRVAKDKAFVTATYSESVLSFGGTANNTRASGAFGRTVNIDLPVFRMRTDINGDQNYFYDPKPTPVPVASRWYDGVPIAIDSQEATIEQVWTALENNAGAYHSSLQMVLVDYDQIIQPGAVRRVRLRFEIPSAIQPFSADFWGDNSAPIPALPRGGQYVYPKFLLPNTQPNISVKTPSQLYRSWTTLPFRVVVTGGNGLEIQ
jgi:hypothetical protein